MAGLFHAFSFALRAKGRLSRLSPTGGPFFLVPSAPGFLDPFCQKPPSDKRFASRRWRFGVNLSKLVNWLHSRVFGHFQKMAFSAFFQKPRLATNLRNSQSRPLHLTTFDQKPPEPKMPFGDGLEAYASRGTKNTGASTAFGRHETESPGETGVFGEIFREILGKFLYAAPRKNFRAVAREKGATRGDFRAKIAKFSREIFAKIARFSPRPARFFSRVRGGLKPRRGDGFRARK